MTDQLPIARKESGVPPEAAFAVFVLFLTNLVGYLDRQILSLFVNPIRESLHLSDGAIGLMQGFAFVLTFTIAGLWIGRLVDKVHRRNLLIVCVCVWTLSAAAGGLAQEGWQLFLARMGVGIGEAALIPTAVSVISDYFKESSRGRAYGLFTTGVYAGSGFSLLLVAFALPYVSRFSSILAESGIYIEPWRLVMFALLVPGAICCALLLALREPDRSSMHSAVPISNMKDSLKSWLQHSSVFLPHHLSMALITLGLYANSAWLPTVFIRDLGFSAEQTGIKLGLIVIVVGVVASSLAGVIADASSARFGVKGRMFAATGCAFAGSAGFILMLIGSRDASIMMWSCALVTGGLSMSIVIGITAMADISNSQNRGIVSAIYFVFTGLIGAAGGPAIVGYTNDLIPDQQTSLAIILGTVGFIAGIVAVALSWYTASVLQRRS